MTKPKTLEQLRAEKERAETQLAQEQHKLERLENRKKYLEKGERQKRTHHSHHWDLFRVALQAYFFYRKTSCSAGTDIHCCSHCRRNQRISHMHNVLLLFVFCFFLFLLYYAKIRPASPRGGYFFRFFRDPFCSLLPIFYEHFV